MPTGRKRQKHKSKGGAQPDIRDTNGHCLHGVREMHLFVLRYTLLGVKNEKAYVTLYPPFFLHSFFLNPLTFLYILPPPSFIMHFYKLSLMKSTRRSGSNPHAPRISHSGNPLTLATRYRVLG